MRLLPSAAAVAVMALTTPAFAAGQAAAPAPAPQAAPAPAQKSDSPEEVAFEAKGEAFGERMEAMAEEMQAAATQADKAKAKTDLDAIQARNQADADTFADEFLAFVVSQGAPADQMGAAAQQIKAYPAMIRAKIEEAVAAAPAGAAPAQPQ